MKKLICTTALLIISWLYVGYYTSIDDAEINTNFFIKRHPTPQIKFINMFANDADNKTLEELSSEELKLVINYCRYRLGVKTTLQTQSELDECKKR